MIDLIYFAVDLFIKYMLVYLLFYFSGRSSLILVSKIYGKTKEIPTELLNIKSNIIYPIIGTAAVGNLLIISNFFIPLKSKFIFFILLIYLSINFLNIDFKDFKKSINISNLIYFIFIPAVLLISSSDINFHYDAAYYHLNNQNWLRESNLILGMVNIFWPFGMSSIYEYLSSILWFDSLVYLHFLSLIFIHVFYAFIFFNLFSNKNTFLKNGSILLIIFSIFDNFGFGGGRNGFIYIQEVGKQDISVAIMICIVSVLIINIFKSNDINDIDLVLISLLTLFVLQVKVSSVYILFLYICLIFFLKTKKTYTFNNLFLTHLPVSFLSFFWLLKNYLSTGCFIFPASFTCVNNFEWYINGSTEKVEAYTTATSFAYLEYFKDENLNFLNWFNDFFNSSQYSVFSNYYASVYLNFIFSFGIIVLLSFIFFYKDKNKSWITNIIFVYLILGIIYLIFYGPIPRYTIGITTLIIYLLGLFKGKQKLNFSKTFLFLIFFISIGLLPRINSYTNFIDTKNISLSDPRSENVITSNFENINWVKPAEADRCWINLSCTFEEGEIKIVKNNIFYTAFKEN